MEKHNSQSANNNSKIILCDKTHRLNRLANSAAGLTKLKLANTKKLIC